MNRNNLKLLLTFIIFIFSYNIQAQEITQVVKGKVIDLDSEMPIIGANVILIGSSPIIGTTTDVNGIYKFASIPIGRQSFKISFIGYEDVYLKEQLVESGKQIVLNVSMKENTSMLESVDIIANDDKSEAINQMTTVSASQITVESTSRIAAGINDPGRTVQSLAGVATSSDNTNDLVIRGNSPRGVLWRMEGVEIPNPNHFSSEGGSGGGVSALSTQVLANSDFITSAFPAEYGNAISGIYDLKLRNGNSEKREYTIQAGVLGLQLAAEGPFKKGSQASYLFNYRYSTFSLLNKTIGSTMGGYIPTWQDLSFKIYVPTKKAGHFSLWGLGGNSLYEDLATKDSSEWSNKYDSRQEVSTNSLGIIGLTHNYLFDNSKTYIRSALTYSGTQNHFVNDTLDYNYNAFSILDLEYNYKTINISSFVNHKFNAKHLIRVGASYKINSYNIKNFNYFAGKHKSQEEGTTNSTQAYLQWKYRVTSKVEFISGVHSSYLLLNGRYTVEPRLGLKWQLNRKNTVSFGFGLHSKAEPVSVYLTQTELPDGSFNNPNLDLDFTKAIHYVVGYNWNFASDFRLKAELYYQYIYSVPVDINDTTGTKTSLNFRTRIPDVKLTNDGTGTNYGVEFTLEKFFSRNWYALITSSIFNSTYTMPGFEERNTLFNSNYIFNIVGGKEYKFGKNKQNILGINVRTIWRGGYRNIPFNETETITQDKPIYDYNMAYNTRLPDYFRLDFGVNYSKNYDKFAWKISLDIQNITNNKNINRQYYSSKDNEIINLYSQGVIPNINFLIEF